MGSWSDLPHGAEPNALMHLLLKFTPGFPSRKGYDPGGVDGDVEKQRLRVGCGWMPAVRGAVPLVQKTGWRRGRRRPERLT